MHCGRQEDRASLAGKSAGQVFILAAGIQKRRAAVTQLHSGLRRLASNDRQELGVAV